ncbi:MAG: hypothetical protein VCB63_05080, partial [Alphaproteobacteria bacterium]
SGHGHPIWPCLMQRDQPFVLCQFVQSLTQALKAVALLPHVKQEKTRAEVNLPIHKLQPLQQVMDFQPRVGPTIFTNPSGYHGPSQTCIAISTQTE